MEIKITSLDSIHEAAKQFIAAMEENSNTTELCIQQIVCIY